MLLNSWLPATLRAAGIKVVEVAGWAGRSHGQFPDRVKVVWHHDASPPGDSPGVVNWLVSNWSNSSANVWIDNYGTWHLVGAGVSWHAGAVKAGMPGNADAVGIETDQTTGEAWPPAQLHSLRLGTAAMFTRQNVDAGWLHFHKTICSPTGRKVDPAGLDLGAERSIVTKLLGGGGAATPPPAGSTPPPTSTPPPKDDDMTPYTEAQMRGFAEAGVRAFASTQEFKDRVMVACVEALSRDAAADLTRAEKGARQFGATQEFRDRVMVACNESIKRAGLT